MEKVNSAPELPEGDAREDAAAAAVLSDDAGETGGGGLRGEGARPPRAMGGPSPNAPVDVGVDAGDAAAGRDAIAEADERASEPRPSSQ